MQNVRFGTNKKIYDCVTFFLTPYLDQNSLRNFFFKTWFKFVFYFDTIETNGYHK